jgi:hypothetical protein
MAEIATRGRTCVELAYGRGQQGGKISSGARRWNAACNLLNQGLVKKTLREVSTLSDRGYSVRICCMIITAAV